MLKLRFAGDKKCLKKDVEGPNSQFLGPWISLYIPFKNTILDYQMDSFELVEGSQSVSVREVMDMKSGKFAIHGLSERVGVFSVIEASGPVHSAYIACPLTMYYSPKRLIIRWKSLFVWTRSLFTYDSRLVRRTHLVCVLNRSLISTQSHCLQDDDCSLEA